MYPEFLKATCSCLPLNNANNFVDWTQANCRLTKTLLQGLGYNIQSKVCHESVKYKQKKLQPEKKKERKIEDRKETKCDLRKPSLTHKKNYETVK